MEDSDEDYSTGSCSTAVEPVQDDSSDTEGPPLRKSLRESVRKKKQPRYEYAAQVRMPKDLSSVNARKRHISKLLKGHDIDRHVSKPLQGRDIDYNLSLRVLAAALELQGDYLQAVSKAGDEKKKSIPPPKIRKTLCEQFHISPSTYSKIHHAYFAHTKVYVSGKHGMGRSGNTTAKATRIPRTKGLLIDVHNFVRSRHLKKERVTGRQILDFLVQEKHLVIPTDESGRYIKKDFDTASRLVRRWVKDVAGFRFNHGDLIAKEENVAEKHHYLKKFFANRNLPAEDRKREVYTGESYIHEHYNRSNDSIWDPNDEVDVQTEKDKQKGRRYCFCAAIQGPNPRVAVSVVDRDKAGVVPGSIVAFCPQKEGDHEGDYNKGFNGDSYMQWWTDQLLPNLTVPSIIILDNAKYHLVYGPHVPKWSEMKKQECRDYLEQKSVPFEPTMSAVELKQLVKKYIEQTEKPEIIRLAEESGHEVLFTPSYYSYPQPIELSWAYVKGRVGRQSSNETTLQMVYDRFMHEFRELENDHDAVLGMIENCTDRAKQLFDEIGEEEELDDGDDDDSSASNPEEEAQDQQQAVQET